MSTVFPAGARVRIIGNIHGSQTVTVLHFGSNLQLVDTADWMGVLLQLAQDVAECAITHLLPVVTSDWTFQRTEAQLITPLLIDPQSHQTPLPNVGQGGPQGGTILSSLVQIRTGRDGRKGRGRMFLPPAGENNIAIGEWDAAWLLALTNFGICLFDKFQQPGGTSDWQIGVLSRKDFESVGGTWSNSFRPAMQLAPQALAASMRTRKKGVGS